MKFTVGTHYSEEDMPVKSEAISSLGESSANHVSCNGFESMKNVNGKLECKATSNDKECTLLNGDSHEDDSPTKIHNGSAMTSDVSSVNGDDTACSQKSSIQMNGEKSLSHTVNGKLESKVPVSMAESTLSHNSHSEVMSYSAVLKGATGMNSDNFHIKSKTPHKASSSKKNSENKSYSAVVNGSCATNDHANHSLNQNGVKSPAKAESKSYSQTDKATNKNQIKTFKLPEIRNSSNNTTHRQSSIKLHVNKNSCSPAPTNSSCNKDKLSQNKEVVNELCKDVSAISVADEIPSSESQQTAAIEPKSDSALLDSTDVMDEAATTNGDIAILDEQLSSAICDSGSDCNEFDSPQRVIDGIEDSTQLSTRTYSEASNDSGKGPSEGEASSCVENQITSMTFEFEIPSHHCGLLIGKRGNFVNHIKKETNAAILITSLPFSKDRKLVAVSGEQDEIEAALAKIRDRFPIDTYPEVTLEESSFSRNRIECPISLKLALPDSVEFQVVISCIVDACHFFVQLPTHPSYHALFPFLQAMTAFYTANDPPHVTNVSVGNIIALPVNEYWHRCEVVEVYENETCKLKFLDYGGYIVSSTSNLRQMRVEFMQMPFQAIECYLSNVTNFEDSVVKTNAVACFDSFVHGHVLSAYVTALATDGTPCLYLYQVNGATHTFINQALVEAGVLSWFELEQ